MNIHNSYREKKAHLLVSIIATGIPYVSGYIINLFLTPYVTRVLGVEAYGYVSLGRNLQSFAMIGASAINAYSSRFITIAYHKGEINKTNRYYSSLIAYNYAISFIAFTVFGFIILFINNFLKIDTVSISDVKILFFFMTCSLCFTIINTPYTSSYYIQDRFDIMGIIRTLGYLVESLMIFMLFSYFPPHIYYVGAGLLVNNCLAIIFNIVVSRRICPELLFNRFAIRVKELLEMLKAGIWYALNSLGNVLNTGLDLLVCNTLLNETDMGQLAVSKIINGIFIGIYQIISVPFQPRFLKLYADSNKNELMEQMGLAMKLSSFFSNVTFAGFVSLGIRFYEWWIPNQNVSMIYNLTIIGCFSNVFEGVVYPAYYIYALTLKNKVPCVITIIGGMINLASMILLINNTNLGVYVVVITTAIIMTFISCVTNPIYMSKCLDIKCSIFYCVIGKCLLSCLLMLVLFLFITGFMEMNSIFGIGMMIFIEIIFSACIHLAVCFSKRERETIIKNVKGIFRCQS